MGLQILNQNGVLRQILHVQGCYCGDISLDHLLRFLHFGEQDRVPDDPGGVFDLPTCLVEPADDTDNGTFQYVCQVGNTVERHSPGPFIDHLGQAKPRPGHEIVGVITGENDLVLGLESVNFDGDRDNCLLSLLQIARQARLNISLFLKHES